jgi:hypothetical protein
MSQQTRERLAYDDPASFTEMSADCRAVQAALTGPLTSAARDLSAEQPKHDIDVPEAASRLASAIYGDA